MPVLSRTLGAMAVVLAAAAVVSVGFADGEATAKPQLRIAAATPFTVVGTGFHAGETVRVIVRGESGSASARDDANAAGRIVVRFRRLALKLGRCPEYAIVARGDEGSTAALRSLPRACGIDPGPAR
jgi:hypothetical protein